MNRLASILYWFALVHISSAQELPDGFDPNFIVTKSCTNLKSQCGLTVSLQCTYFDVNGNIASCLDTNLDTNRPVATLSREQCEAKRSIPAKIQYRICNDNSEEFNPDPDESDIRFRKERSVKPDGWDSPLSGFTCRSHIAVEDVDLCKETRVVDVEMDGRLDKAIPNYCRCYLYKESNLVIYTPTPTTTPTKSPTNLPTAIPTKTPTKSVTKAPTVPPTTAPTKTPTATPTKTPTATPTKTPTKSPTSQPTSTPTPNDCKFFFTEFADPLDNADAGFIEIRTTCPPGMRIPMDLYVETWKTSCPYRAFLNAIEFVPNDGYIIICKKRSTFMAAYDKVCDIEDADVQPMGIQSIALKDDDKIIDLYGIEGEALPASLIFKDGRAVRDVNAVIPSVNCIVEDWHIIPGNDKGSPNAVTSDMDPRDWKPDGLILFFTEFADPSDNHNKRFIELYSPNRRNYLITEDLYIYRYAPGSSNPSGTFNLKGIRINGSGFIVLCVDSNWTNKCTYTAGYASIVYSPGIFAFTLEECPNGSSCQTIDSYGVGCYSNGHSYLLGRAVRKKSAVPRPSSDFRLGNWDIIKPASSSYADPGEWMDSAGSSPSSGSGKGKGRNSPSKIRRLR